MAVTWRKSERDKVLQALSDANSVIVFDTETTGLSPEQNEIIELAAIRFQVKDGEIGECVDTLHLYIRPSEPVPPHITEITGITNEQLENCPTEKDAFRTIHRFFCGNPLIAAYSSGFDVRFMKALYARHFQTFCYREELDVLLMARDHIKADETENYKQSTIAHLYGLDEGLRFHSALDDATACSRLFKLFFQMYREKETTQQCGTLRPEILSVNYWEGYQGNPRLYVNTSVGSIYYDARRKIWGEKDASIETLDMEHIERSVVAMYDKTNIEDVVRCVRGHK